MFESQIHVASEPGFGLAHEIAAATPSRTSPGPAKRGPEAVERIVRLYERDRNLGEAFNAFFDRVGPAVFEAEVEDLTIPGEFSDDNQQMFIDWNRLELYQLQRGEGECAI